MPRSTEWVLAHADELAQRFEDDDPAKRGPGRKDTRNWCRGKTGVAHVPAIVFRSPMWNDQAVCKWCPLYSRGLDVTWCCYHREECDRCGKILRDGETFDLGDGECPDYPGQPEQRAEAEKEAIAAAERLAAWRRWKPPITGPQGYRRAR
jgi:hypothetical protein